MGNHDCTSWWSGGHVFKYVRDLWMTYIEDSGPFGDIKTGELREEYICIHCGYRMSQRPQQLY